METIPLVSARARADVGLGRRPLQLTTFLTSRGEFLYVAYLDDLAIDPGIDGGSRSPSRSPVRRRHVGDSDRALRFSAFLAEGCWQGARDHGRRS